MKMVSLFCSPVPSVKIITLLISVSMNPEFVSPLSLMSQEGLAAVNDM